MFVLASNGRNIECEHGVLQKKKKSLTFSCRSPLQIFVREPNCPSFETSVNRDFTANQYLAEPFDFLWPTLFICVQNFTSSFMLETVQRVVVTAQRGLSNCAAAHARSLEGTLLATNLDCTSMPIKRNPTMLIITSSIIEN